MSDTLLVLTRSSLWEIITQSITAMKSDTSRVLDEDKDEEVTVRIGQRDAVLSGHEDLSRVAQSYLGSWILVNDQVN